MGYRSRFSYIIVRSDRQDRGACMGRARPFVCAFDCVGMEIRWTARTVVARAWDGRLLVRRLRAFDCSSVWPARDGRLLVRSSARVRLRLHVAWAWETWAWKRHGAADGTSARAWDEQDLVRVVCLAALVRVVCSCRRRMRRFRLMVSTACGLIHTHHSSAVSKILL